MKLSNFLVTFSACALFAACANDEFVADTPTGGEADSGDKAYIAVNLMTPNNAMTRATFDYGSTEEYAVSSARFYFFDNNGTAVTVSGSVNFIDVTSGITVTGSSSSPSEGNVEATTTILALDNNGAAPTRMVVVLNLPSAAATTADAGGTTTATPDYTTSKSLSELQGIMDDYLKPVTDAASAASQQNNGDTKGYFVMSNSVYANSSTEVVATDISGKLQATEDAATASPVSVYVERVLAKVDVTQGTSGSGSAITDQTQALETQVNLPTSAIETETTSGGETKTSDGSVTAKIKGWTVVNRSKKSYLLKDIEASTWNTTAPFDSWNDATNFRCYWAQTPQSDNDLENSESYSDITNLTAQYCQEKTAGTTPELVVTAELQVDGKAQTIARYASQYWTLEGLKTTIVNTINNTTSTSKIYYKQTTTGDANAQSNDTWTPITKDMITFRNRDTDEEGTFKAYQSIATLVDTYETGYSFAKDANGSSTYENVAAVNEVLENYVALIWDEGKTYYHLPIKHATKNSTDVNGIVRNHFYKINITGVNGLGTPVPPSEGEGGGGDDEEPIDPEDPEDSNSYLAAEINILSWNVISNDVTLGGDSSGE